MNRRNKYYLQLIILIVSSLISAARTQSRYDSAYIEMAKRHPENLVVFTDRSLYAVNEDIRFSAFLQSGGDQYHGIGSLVLYTELLNTAGSAVSKGIFPISENWSGGYISIPSNLSSGNYFLRCYTRWMRNFGSQDYAYVPIRVVNPYSSEVEIDITEPEKKELDPVPKGSRVVSISPASPIYHTGELVELDLSLKEETMAHIQHGCITVVPSGAIDTSVFQ